MEKYLLEYRRSMICHEIISIEDSYGEPGELVEAIAILVDLHYRIAYTAVSSYKETFTTYANRVTNIRNKIHLEG